MAQETSDPFQTRRDKGRRLPGSTRVSDAQPPGQPLTLFQVHFTGTVPSPVRGRCQRRRPPPTNGAVGFCAKSLSGLRRRLRDNGLTPSRPAVTFMTLQPTGCKPTSSPTSLTKRTSPNSTIPKTGTERRWSVACSSNRTDQEQRSKPGILMTALGAWMDSTPSRPPPTPVCQQSPP